MKHISRSADPRVGRTRIGHAGLYPESKEILLEASIHTYHISKCVAGTLELLNIMNLDMEIKTQRLHK